MKHGLMVQATRVPIKMVKSMDKVFSPGLTDPLTTAVLWTTILKVTVFTIGKTAASTKVTGTTTKCRGRVSSSGLTVVTTRATTWTIRRRVTAYFTGRMVASTTVNG